MDINWDEAPEGATHYDTGFHLFCNERGFWWQSGLWVPDNEQHEWGTIRYIQRPVQWNGEGIPPVGTVCEHEPDGFSDKWVTVEVLAHREFKGHDTGLLVVFATEDDVSFSSPECFRPIKTKEQIAAEERLHKIRNAFTDISHTLDYLKGDIPGAAIARTVIEAMIDAGYRKQENN